MKTAQIFDGHIGQRLQLDPTFNMACSSSYSMPSQSLPSPSGKEDVRDQLSISEKLTVTDGNGSSNASSLSANNSDEHLCVVCGDGGAKMHYGVLACLGCKGFFRRALKKANEYECLRNNDCKIDKYERNSCRACRLQKCLDTGMDPFAVRPDRDFTGKQRCNFKLAAMITGKGSCGRRRSGEKLRNEETTPLCTPVATISLDLISRKKTGSCKPLSKKEFHRFSSNEWIKRLPVEMRTMLMSLLNMEAQVTRGDTSRDASEIYPLGISTLKEIIDEPTKLKGRRTEMRYEPYRMARNEEFSAIVYRRLIAAIDWVNLLAEMMTDGLSTEDKIVLVKSAFGPLTLFKCSARTAAATKNDNVLCLCNFAYVPRDIAKAYSDTYHLDNGLVDRLLNQLVLPFRRIHLTDEEIVCLSAIIVLNPMAKDLSEDGTFKVNQLRNRIYDTLYAIVKELRGNCATAATIASPASQFGNLLLFLPIVTYCANMMSENLRFAQTFSSLGGIPLLTSLFGCFPVEPFLESEFSAATDLNMKSVDDGVSSKGVAFNESAPLLDGNSDCLEPLSCAIESNCYSNSRAQSDNTAAHGKKRRLPLESIEEGSVSDFWLLRAPCAYTLTEMFDDRTVQEEEFALTDEQSAQPFPVQKDIIGPSYNLQKPQAQKPISKSNSFQGSPGVKSADMGPLLFLSDSRYQQQQQRYGSDPLVSSISRGQPQWHGDFPQMMSTLHPLSSSVSCQWSSTGGCTDSRMTSASKYWTASGGTAVSGLIAETASAEHCKQPRQLIGRRQTLPRNMEFHVSAAASARQCYANNNLPDSSRTVNDNHNICFNNDRQLQYDTGEYVAQCSAAEGSTSPLYQDDDIGCSSYSVEVQSLQQHKQWPATAAMGTDCNNMLSELNSGAPILAPPMPNNFSTGGYYCGGEMVPSARNCYNNVVGQFSNGMRQSTNVNSNIIQNTNPSITFFENNTTQFPHFSGIK